MTIKLSFTNPNLTSTVNIYHSDRPIDTSDLGTPKVSLTNRETTWLDTTPFIGVNNYYVIETIVGGKRSVSSNYIALGAPYKGIGPQTVIKGDDNYGYMGYIAATDFIGAGDLKNAVGLNGTLISNTEQVLWHKWTYKGKYYYVPQTSLVSTISWLDLYNRGLVFGTDNNGTGPFLPAAGVNQNKRLLIKGEIFIVRLLKGHSLNPDYDPGNIIATADPVDYANISEWDLFVAPLYKFVTSKQQMANVTVNKNVTFVGAYNMHCQERKTSLQTITRGYPGNVREAISYLQLTAYNGAGASNGWMPILEYVGDEE